MAATKILVISPSEAVSALLSRELPADRYRVASTRPGPGVLGAVVTLRPDVVVVDRIDARPEAAQLEVALVKARCPETRIVVVSGRSSGADASVLEQGVFYYMTSPGGQELVRVLESAARGHSTTGGMR